jgi:hypothetical protein
LVGGGFCAIQGVSFLGIKYLDVKILDAYKHGAKIITPRRLPGKAARLPLGG